MKIVSCIGEFCSWLPKMVLACDWANPFVKQGDEKCWVRSCIFFNFRQIHSSITDSVYLSQSKQHCLWHKCASCGRYLFFKTLFVFNSFTLTVLTVLFRCPRQEGCTAPSFDLFVFTVSVLLFDQIQAALLNSFYSVSFLKIRF